MNLTGICVFCLVLLACVTGFQFYKLLTLQLPQRCAVYSTKNPTPEGGYATEYGTVCRNGAGDWIIRR